ncbi:STAS domain-containing protein [candidate division KSB1 bacterium]|nr:STAS domain-containing protein [candidate division KSB1 bacterium]
MEINTKMIDSAVVIEPVGDIDLYSSVEVRKKVLSFIQKQIPILLIDLGKVDYMDSSGVATLVEGLQGVRKYGGRLALVNLATGVKAVFELSRLDKVFDIFESMEKAIAK